MEQAELLARADGTATAPACPCCGGDSKFTDEVYGRRALKRLGILLGDATLFDRLDIIPYRICQCSACGLQFADPMTEASPEVYGLLEQAHEYYPADRWEWAECLHQIRTIRGNPTDGQPVIVLDIGCGDGQFLKLVRELDGVRAVGLDVNPDAVAACQSRGVEAFCGTFDEIRPQLPDGVDAITLWHVVEHVSDPIGLLCSAASLLREGGRIYFSVPLSPLSYEESWPDPLNAPPHHLTRWSITALEALSAKLGMGVQLSLPDAPPLPARVLRSLTLQAVAPFLRMTRREKALRLLRFIASRPWQPIVDLQRQIRLPRVNGKVRPDLVVVSLHTEP